jgi:DNA polymerase
MEKLEELRKSIKDCLKCKLADYRTQVVFGVGNANADLMFVGEAPGFNEDQQGEPFVGAAGKLLDKVILEETGLTRQEIYITNVVKCRPPNNRNPENDEIIACNPVLTKQIELIKPKVICALGNIAARTLLNKNEGISKLRGKVYRYGEIKVIPTYHPAAILRSPNLIEDFRSDIRLAFSLLNTSDEIEKEKAEKVYEQPSLF